MQYEKKYSRRKTFDIIIKRILEIALARVSAEHLRNKQKQLAVFSFDYIANNISVFAVYEGSELDILVEWLKKEFPPIFDGVALDIGANIGNHSLYFSDLFRKVIAFEPSNRTFKLLSFNAGLASNITPHNFGLSDKNGEATLNTNSENIGGASISDEGSQNSQKIVLRTLDSVIDQDENVTLMKIDVEGHELQAIAGAKDTISRNKPIILFEQFSEEFADGSSKVIDLLKTMGYANFLIIEHLPSLSYSLPKIIRRPLFFLQRLVVGDSIRIVPCKHFEQKYYSSIIAVP